MITTQSNMQEDVRPANPCGSYTPTPEATPPHSHFMAIWSMKNWCCRTHQSFVSKRSSVHSYNNWLLLKVGGSSTTPEVKTTNMVNFIKHHVIHRFGVPWWIIHDNGPQFVSQSFYRFCDKYRIQNVGSTAYNLATNGLAKAFNKTIIKLLKKFISSSKWDWNEKLSECLWAYPMTVQSPTGNTHFSLVCGCKAVIPLEILLELAFDDTFVKTFQWSSILQAYSRVLHDQDFPKRVAMDVYCNV